MRACEELNLNGLLPDAKDFSFLKPLPRIKKLELVSYSSSVPERYSYYYVSSVTHDIESLAQLPELESIDLSGRRSIIQSLLNRGLPG